MNRKYTAKVEYEVTLVGAYRLTRDAPDLDEDLATSIVTEVVRAAVDAEHGGDFHGTMGFGLDTANNNEDVLVAFPIEDWYSFPRFTGHLDEHRYVTEVKSDLTLWGEIDYSVHETTWIYEGPEQEGSG